MKITYNRTQGEPMKLNTYIIIIGFFILLITIVLLEFRHEIRDSYESRKQARIQSENEWHCMALCNFGLFDNGASLVCYYDCLEAREKYCGDLQ